MHLSSVLESMPDVTDSEEAVLVLLGSVSEVLNSGVDAAQVHEGINDSGNSGGFPVESTVESGPSRWQTARGPGDGGDPARTPARTTGRERRPGSRLLLPGKS